MVCDSFSFASFLWRINANTKNARKLCDFKAFQSERDCKIDLVSFLSIFGVT